MMSPLHRKLLCVIGGLLLLDVCNGSPHISIHKGKPAPHVNSNKPWTSVGLYQQPSASSNKPMAPSQWPQAGSGAQNKPQLNFQFQEIGEPEPIANNLTAPVFSSSQSTLGNSQSHTIVTSTSADGGQLHTESSELASFEPENSIEIPNRPPLNNVDILGSIEVSPPIILEPVSVYQQGDSLPSVINDLQDISEASSVSAPINEHLSQTGILTADATLNLEAGMQTLDGSTNGIHQEVDDLLQSEEEQSFNIDAYLAQANLVYGNHNPNPVANQQEINGSQIGMMSPVEAPNSQGQQPAVEAPVAVEPALSNMSPGPDSISSILPESPHLPEHVSTSPTFEQAVPETHPALSESDSPHYISISASTHADYNPPHGQPSQSISVDMSTGEHLSISAPMPPPVQVEPSMTSTNEDAQQVDAENFALPPPSVESDNPSTPLEQPSNPTLEEDDATYFAQVAVQVDPQEESLGDQTPENEQLSNVDMQESDQEELESGPEPDTVLGEIHPVHQAHPFSPAMTEVIANHPVNLPGSGQSNVEMEVLGAPIHAGSVGSTIAEEYDQHLENAEQMFQLPVSFNPSSSSPPNSVEDVLPEVPSSIMAVVHGPTPVATPEQPIQASVTPITAAEIVPAHADEQTFSNPLPQPVSQFPDLPPVNQQHPNPPSQAITGAISDTIANIAAANQAVLDTNFVDAVEAGASHISGNVEAPNADLDVFQAAHPSVPTSMSETASSIPNFQESYSSAHISSPSITYSHESSSSNNQAFGNVETVHLPVSPPSEDGHVIVISTPESDGNLLQLEQDEEDYPPFNVEEYLAQAALLLSQGNGIPAYNPPAVEITQEIYVQPVVDIPDFQGSEVSQNDPGVLEDSVQQAGEMLQEMNAPETSNYSAFVNEPIVEVPAPSIQQNTVTGYLVVAPESELLSELHEQVQDASKPSEILTGADTNEQYSAGVLPISDLIIPENFVNGISNMDIYPSPNTVPVSTEVQSGHASYLATQTAQQEPNSTSLPLHADQESQVYSPVESTILGSPEAHGHAPSNSGQSYHAQQPNVPSVNLDAYIDGLPQYFDEEPQVYSLAELSEANSHTPNNTNQQGPNNYQHAYSAQQQPNIPSVNLAEYIDGMPNVVMAAENAANPIFAPTISDHRAIPRPPLGPMGPIPPMGMGPIYTYSGGKLNQGSELSYLNGSIASLNSANQNGTFSVFEGGKHPANSMVNVLSNTMYTSQVPTPDKLQVGGFGVPLPGNMAAFVSSKPLSVPFPLSNNVQALMNTSTTNSSAPSESNTFHHYYFPEDSVKHASISISNGMIRPAVGPVFLEAEESIVGELESDIKSLDGLDSPLMLVEALLGKRSHQQEKQTKQGTDPESCKISTRAGCKKEENVDFEKEMVRMQPETNPSVDGPLPSGNNTEAKQKTEIVAQTEAKKDEQTEEKRAPAVAHLEVFQSTKDIKPEEANNSTNRAPPAAHQQQKKPSDAPPEKVQKENHVPQETSQAPQPAPASLPKDSPPAVAGPTGPTLPELPMPPPSMGLPLLPEPINVPAPAVFELFMPEAPTIPFINVPFTPDDIADMILSVDIPSVPEASKVPAPMSDASVPRQPARKPQSHNSPKHQTEPKIQPTSSIAVAASAQQESVPEAQMENPIPPQMAEVVKEGVSGDHEYSMLSHEDGVQSERPMSDNVPIEKARPIDRLPSPVPSNPTNSQPEKTCGCSNSNKDVSATTPELENVADEDVHMVHGRPLRPIRPKRPMRPAAGSKTRPKNKPPGKKSENNVPAVTQKQDDLEVPDLISVPPAEASSTVSEPYKLTIFGWDIPLPNWSAFTDIFMSFFGNKFRTTSGEFTCDVSDDDSTELRSELDVDFLCDDEKSRREMVDSTVCSMFCSTNGFRSGVCMPQKMCLCYMTEDKNFAIRLERLPQSHYNGTGENKDYNVNGEEITDNSCQSCRCLKSCRSRGKYVGYCSKSCHCGVPWYNEVPNQISDVKKET